MAECADPKFDRTMAVMIARSRRQLGEAARESWCENCKAHHVVDTIHPSISVSDVDRKILFFLAMGLSMEMIADAELKQLTNPMVRAHVNKLMRRFGTLSQANLVAWAIHNRIIDVSSFCTIEGDQFANTDL